MTFLLGTHHAYWLGKAGVPLFVSRRALLHRPTATPAIAPWALDSGGFTELAKFGGWFVSAREYAAQARGWMDRLGYMAWAAPQDWMCEPAMLKRTGLSIAEHQRRTVDNYLELRSVAPDVPWVPVLQGWRVDDYLRCADAYEAAGVVLAKQPLVGVGTVCRRQATNEAVKIIEACRERAPRLHGFGFKIQGLSRSKLASADSLAWSYNARRNPPMAGHRHKHCNNCLPWALRWRERALAAHAP